jgi:hypothetical protein
MSRLFRIVLWGCALIAAERLFAGAVTSAASSLLAAPTGLTASVNGNSVMLHWAAGSVPVTSYIVEVGSFPGYTDLAVFDTGSVVTSMTAVAVPPRNYWVRVRARAGSETSDASNEVRVVVAGGQCSETLYAPYGWRASGQGSSVTLAWETPLIGCPPTEYIIEAGSRPLATDLANYRTGSAATTYVATNVPSGTYYVRLRSANNVGVSFQTEERIIAVGTSPCVYSVGPSTIAISRGGLNGSISIGADPGCAWTITADVPWLLAPFGLLPANGSGNRSMNLPINANIGPVRTGTILVRWAGGGVDVPVSQNGFGLSPSNP